MSANTKAIVLTYASNVCGTILPLKEIDKICKEMGIFFVVDSAQTAGSLAIDFGDGTSNQYIFNMNTKGLTPGTYLLTINLGRRHGLLC